MAMWTRANGVSQAELVRRAVAEFLDRQSLADLGIDIDSLGLGARFTRQLKKLNL